MAQQGRNNPMQTHPKRYKVRSGTIDSGKEYEVKVAALMFLRGILQGFEDIWLVSNAENVGAFDDLVMQVKMPQDNPITYMVQIKHKDNSKIIQEQELLATSGNFAFLSYLKDIDKLYTSISNISKKGLIKDLGLFNDIYFVLFSNRPVNRNFRPELLEASHDNNLLLLNTAVKVDNSVFSVNLNKLPLQLDLNHSNKYSKVFLLAGQVDIKQIDEAILEEIRKLVDFSGNTPIDFQNLIQNFIKYVTDWAKGLLGGHYYLTKEEVVQKLEELFLYQYCINLNKTQFVDYSNPKTLIWSEIVSDKPIAVIDSHTSVLSFLIDYVCGEVKKYCTTAAKTWDSKIPEKEQQLFYKKQNELKRSMVKLVGNHGKITPLDVYKCLWGLNKIPALLEVNNEEDGENIMRILKFSNYNRKVIILNKCTFENFGGLKPFVSLNDLVEEHQSKILTQTVSIQGRRGALLKELLDEETYSLIKCADIVNILTGEFNIGENFEPLFDYFIERSIIKTLIKPDFLRFIGTDEIVLLEKNSDFFDALVDELSVAEIESVEFERPDKIPNLIIFQKSITNVQMEKLMLVAVNKAIHILTIYDDSYLNWKWSSRSTNTIELFKVRLEQQLEADVLNKLLNTINIVSDQAGMGKSVLMSYISLHAPPTHWVLRIDLNRFQSYFRQINCKDSMTKASSHLNYFYDTIYNSRKDELTKAIFEKLAKEKNVIVILDGFDEVSITYKDEATNIAKTLFKENFKIWITTRPLMKNHLVNTFKTFSITIKPFSTDDQKQFLFKYFTKAHVDLSSGSAVIRRFIEELLEVARNNLNDKEARFMGVPLQTKLLAEVFSNDCRKYLCNEGVSINKSFDLLYLYEHFINKKIDILVDKYGESARDTHRLIKDCQSFAALKLVFPLEDLFESDVLKKLHDAYFNQPNKIQLLEKDGIITVDQDHSITCVHRTFAEYLAAVWLTENLRNSDEQLKIVAQNLIKERFSWNYKFLFSIFDRILTNGQPLHTDIVNGNLDSVKNALTSNYDCVNTTDKGGRTILHLAALYGPPHLERYKHEVIVKEFQERILNIIKAIPNEVLSTVGSDLIGFSPLDYALVNGALGFADEIYNKFRISEIRVSVNLNLERHYMYYCSVLYPNLFKLLFPYFISRNLLLGNIKKCTIMSNYLEKRFYSDESYESIRNFESMDILKFLVSNSHFAYPLYTNKCCYSYYSDLRYAVSFGSKANVRDLLVKGAEVNKSDIDRQTPLHYAVLHGRLNIVKILLNNGAFVNKRNEMNETALHLAVLQCNEKVVKLLLSRGAAINMFNINGETELHLTIKERIGFTKTVRQMKTIMAILFRNDANINAANKEGETALYCSVESGNYFIVMELLNSGAQVNQGNFSANAPLHIASWKGHFNIVELLLARGAELNAKNADGETAFNLALRQQLPEVAEMLLVHGAGNDTVDKDGMSPLHAALYKGYLNIAKLLLVKEENINTVDKDGYTLLHLASKRGHLDIVNLLLSKGAFINVENRYGKTPFYLALMHGYPHVAELLLNKGAITNTILHNNILPIHLASRDGHLHMVKLLLAKGADINSKNEYDNTPLHVALKYGHPPIAELLLNEGACVNTVNNDGNTPLHLTSWGGYLNVLNLLLSKGAIIEAENAKGDSPLHIALEQGYPEIAEVLLAKIATIDENNILLHMASAKGYLNIVELLIAKISNIDTMDKNGNTTLHVASRAGHLDIVQLLLNKGAQPNVTDVNCDNPLHFASREGHLYIVELLLIKGANIDAKNLYSDTPLHLTLKNGFLNIAELLLAKGANANIKDKSGHTPIHFAVAEGYLNMVKLLISKGADSNAKNSNCDTPLHLAVQKGRLNIVNFLLASEAIVSPENEDGDTPLHLALKNKGLDIAKLLISKTIDVNTENDDGTTPLHEVSIQGHFDFAKLLLWKGAKINIPNNNGDTALHLAIKHGNLNIAILLLAERALVDKANRDGNTPLHLASIKGYGNIVKLILVQKADINTKNKSSDTPLALAVWFGNLNIVKVLLAKGASMDAANKLGNTPLHLASTKGNVNIAKVLLVQNAGINTKNTNLDTPLDLAVWFGNISIVKMLLAKGVSIDAENKLGNTPLHLATSKGYLSITKLLIDKGFNVNKKNKTGVTSLHLASWLGHFEIVKLLLGKGADINVVDNNSCTSLDLASKAGHLHIEELLLKELHRTVNINTLPSNSL